MPDIREEGDVDQQLRLRVHKLADVVQQHEGIIREHSVRLEMNEKSIESVRASSATIGQLEGASALMKQALDNTEKTITLKLENLANDLMPIKRGVYWAVTLILGAVILGLVTLLINGAPPKGLTP